MANITASVNLRFAAGGNDYSVDFRLPSSTPTDEAPLVFNVASGDPKLGEGKLENFATVAVGGKDENTGETHFYAHIAPPNAVMPEAIKEVVKEVGVTVSCGEYQDGAFTKALPEPAQPDKPASPDKPVTPEKPVTEEDAK